MAKAQFKVGDRVRLLEPYPHSTPKVGQEGVVSYVSAAASCIGVHWDSLMGEYYYNTERLDAIEPTISPEMVH